MGLASSMESVATNISQGMSKNMKSAMEANSQTMVENQQKMGIFGSIESIF